MLSHPLCYSIGKAEIMNPVLDLIFSRRSVRAYREADVPDALIHDILEAAMAAPSAVARDPWHFVAVKDKAVLRQLTEGLPNGQMLADATVGIVVCGEQKAAHDEKLSYLLQDCSAAVENILIAASALGLGACWLGVHPRDERVLHVQKVLEIPETVTPIAVVAIGWPRGKPKPRTRYDQSKVHYEQW